MNNRKIASKDDALVFLYDKVANVTGTTAHYRINETDAKGLEKKFGKMSEGKLSKRELGIGINKVNQGLYLLLFRDVPKFKKYYEKNFIADNAQTEKTTSNNEKLDTAKIKTVESENIQNENNNNNNSNNNTNRSKRKSDCLEEVDATQGTNPQRRDSALSSFHNGLFNHSDSETTREEVKTLDPPSPQ